MRKLLRPGEPALATDATCAMPLACCPTDNPIGLFYYQPSNSGVDAGCVVGASPRDVLAATVPPGGWRLDAAWLVAWLTQESDPSRTPFEGLRRLLPGQELLQNSPGHLAVHNTIGSSSWGRADLAAQAAAPLFQAAFTQALDRLVAAGGPLTCELSGGLDSTFTVAQLARKLRDRGDTLTAYCLVPHPNAAAAVCGRPTCELPLAQALADEYPDVIDLRPVSVPHHHNTLAFMRRAAADAAWPCYGNATLGGFQVIKQEAARLGSAFVITSVHGNAAFSYQPPARARLGRSGSRPLLQLLRRQPGSLPKDPFLHRSKTEKRRDDRGAYLRWLAGHEDLNAVIQLGLQGAPRRDPYRALEVLNVAARLRSDAWRGSGTSRGFARDLGAQVVPDLIRLSQTRALQGTDAWFTTVEHRDDYFDALSTLQGEPLLQDVVDVPAVRRTLRSWPWGSPTDAPDLGELIQVTRILAFGYFLSDMRSWLATLSEHHERAAPCQ